MSRSNWKGAFIKKISNKTISSKKITIWTRESAIPLCLLDNYVHIYNGKSFKKIKITREKIGYKFGEFAYTKKNRLNYGTKRKR